MHVVDMMMTGFVHSFKAFENSESKGSSGSSCDIFLVHLDFFIFHSSHKLIGFLGLSLDFWCLENQLVDNRSANATQNGSKPIHPMVIPESQDGSGSKSPGRVHARSGEGDGKQVASSNGESDSQWSRSFDVGSIVVIRSSTENAEHQDKSDQEFNAKSLNSIKRT